jgi:hypothetical protein
MTSIIMTYLFVPDTWGTVSDWVMIIVTFATAILLLCTLNSQKNVQRIQTELFRIESIRFRESIKPILNFSLSKFQMKSSNEKKKMLTIEVTNETNNIALKISRFVSENEKTQQLFTVLGFGDKRDHLSKGDDPLLFHFGIDSESHGLHFLFFTFKYQDIAETIYQQRVICIFDEDNGVELHRGLPEIITKEDSEQKLIKI